MRKIFALQGCVGHEVVGPYEVSKAVLPCWRAGHTLDPHIFSGRYIVVVSESI